MNKILKIFLIILGVLFLLLGSLALYLYANQSIIKNYFIQKLNEQLEAKVTIEQIDIELFKQFPKVSLDLKEVAISSPLDKKINLLTTQHIFIGFNIYDIISKNYDIKLITLDSGTCNILVDKNGRYNFDILKTSSPSEKSENIFLKLKKVNLNNLRINYLDLQSNQHYSLLANDVTLSGSFTNTKENISCSGNLFVEKFKTGSINLVKDKNVVLDIILGIDADKKLFHIKKGRIDIDELKLEVQGDIKNNTKNTFVDLSFNAHQLSITSLLSLLPFKIAELNDYKSSGDIYFKGSVKGAITSKEQAAIEIDFGIKNGQLNRASNNLDIDKISFVGHFSNGKKKDLESSSLSFKNLFMQIKDGQVKGDLSISNFKTPFIDANVDGEMDALQLINIIHTKDLNSAEGNVRFSINLKGRVADFSNKNNWSQTHTSGVFDMNLQHIKIANTTEIPLLKASFSLAQNDILIQNFQAKLEQSDITIKGKLINVIPYFLLDKQTIEVDIDYTSDYIDLNHVMLPLSSSNKNDQKTTPLQLPENIILSAKVDVKKFVFYNFSASNVKAAINWKGKKLSVENLNCQTMHGTISASGQVENALDGRFLITSTLGLKNININELFHQCENFGQTELTEKHLFGVINTSIDVASVWSAKLDCDLDKLYAFADVQILNGEIIGYKPLEALSKYVDIADLRDLKFAELKNKIEIKNKTIVIPGMEVKSNALNITLSGTHTFNNYLDYKFRLKLSELLKKKRKPELNEFGEEEENGGKGLYLYLSMKGPIDNLKFGYDKTGVKTKIKQDLKQEKENIKQILKKELGIEKDPSIKEKKNDNEELEFERD